MQALANISQFESLSENAEQSGLRVFNPEQMESCAVENTGINLDSDKLQPKVQPVAPSQKVGDRKPEQNVWGWTQQREWNAKMERKVDAGFAEIKQLITSR